MPFRKRSQLELGRSGIPTAQVFIVTAEGRMLVWMAGATENFDPNVTNLAMRPSLRRSGEAGGRPGTTSTTSLVDPGDDSEVKSRARRLRSAARRAAPPGQRRAHGLVTLITLPQRSCLTQPILQEPDRCGCWALPAPFTILVGLGSRRVVRAFPCSRSSRSRARFRRGSSITARGSSAGTSSATSPSRSIRRSTSWSERDQPDPRR